ncbi:MAG: helix-turn-helix transcriptional regulator [Gordonia sp. (in: high G+C Gram-positive bacteria)]|uniref:LuxR C-terminal-related transcriptional regulator n=1 Tax=Gordonia sp. (in: high G+C Gram-positive bacteria) TaxID=84139 RepID=UPI003C756E59
MTVSETVPLLDQRRREALDRLRRRAMPLPGRPLPGRPLPGRAQSGRGLCAVPAPSAPSAPAPQPVKPPRPSHPHPDLTRREIQVLRTWLMLDSKPAVAQALSISLGTVNTHLTRIRTKYADLGRPASTKAALVARAIQDGVVDIDEL